MGCCHKPKIMMCNSRCQLEHCKTCCHWILLSHFFPRGGRRCWNLSQHSMGRRQETLWTGHQSITGQTLRHTHSLRLISIFSSPKCLSLSCRRFIPTYMPDPIAQAYPVCRIPPGIQEESCIFQWLLTCHSSMSASIATKCLVSVLRNALSQFGSPFTQ